MDKVKHFSTKLHDKDCLERWMTTGKQNCRACSDDFYQARQLYLGTFKPETIDRIMEIEREEE